MISMDRLGSRGGFTFIEVQSAVILIVIAVSGLALLLMNTSTQSAKTRETDRIFSYINYVPSAEGNFMLVTEISTGATHATAQAVVESISRTGGTSQTAVVALYPN